MCLVEVFLDGCDDAGGGGLPLPGVRRGPDLGRLRPPLRVPADSLHQLPGLQLRGGDGGARAPGLVLLGLRIIQK